MKRLTKHIFDNNLYLALKVGVTTSWDRLKMKVGGKKAAIFKEVETCCFFIGYPRSGHSIISSIMDAHQHCLIAHRLDAIKYYEKGHKVADLFYLMLRNSERFGQSNRTLTAYQYQIANQWQGKFSSLKVIGDQEGNWTARRLGENPKLLAQLLQTKGIKLKFIHVIRNPFDNITTWALRSADTIASRTVKYFELAENVHNIQKQLTPDQILNIRHEDFIAQPEKWIKIIFNFLELEITANFLKDCSAIVFQKPHKSRHNLEWSPKAIEKVKDAMKKYPFLDGYTFN